MSSSPHNTPRTRRCFGGLSSAFAMLAITLAMPATSWAQLISVGGGFGAPAGGFWGIPKATYVENEVVSEFRVVPEAGYYPVLRERTNAGFSGHAHASVIFDDLKSDIVDGLAVRLSYGEFSWAKAIATHTSCTPVERVDGSFDDATTVYEEIGSITCDDRRLVDEGYETTTDVSQLDLPKLRVFNADVDGIVHLMQHSGWTVWVNGGGGLTIATFDDPSAEYYFGVDAAVGLGASVALGPVLSLEIDSRASVILTEAPESAESRINHEIDTGGNIFSTLFEAFGFYEIQFGLRFDLTPAS